MWGVLPTAYSFLLMLKWVLCRWSWYRTLRSFGTFLCWANIILEVIQYKNFISNIWKNDWFWSAIVHKEIKASTWIFFCFLDIGLTRFGHASNFASLFTRLTMCEVGSSEICPEGFFCDQLLLHNSWAVYFLNTEWYKIISDINWSLISTPWSDTGWLNTKS